MAASLAASQRSVRQRTKTVQRECRESDSSGVIKNSPAHTDPTIGLRLCLSSKDHLNRPARMSIKPKSHIEITIESMKVFMNDGQLDIAELNFLLGLAMRDNGIDDDERRVLKNIIARAEKSPMDTSTRAHVEQVKLEYNLG